MPFDAVRQARAIAVLLCLALVASCQIFGPSVEEKDEGSFKDETRELWSPAEGEGLGAAEALRQAQAFVRGHEKWKHPYFWAAWVLWGLPE